MFTQIFTRRPDFKNNRIHFQRVLLQYYVYYYSLIFVIKRLPTIDFQKASILYKNFIRI